jgi:hypothetical protein
MRVRRYAEFDSTLPSGAIETEDGMEFVQLGGKPQTEAIVEILNRLGCEAGPVEDAFDHGWDFTGEYGKQSVWGQITDIGRYLFIFEERDDLFFRPKVTKAKPAFVELLTKLAAEMARDERFTNVCWLFEDEITVDHPGSPVPVTDD